MNQPEHDDTLPHQIRLYTKSGKGTVHVSCNCQVRYSVYGGRPGYQSFGISANTREAKALYNDVTKHDQSRAPFTVEHLLEER